MGDLGPYRANMNLVELQAPLRLLRAVPGPCKAFKGLKGLIRPRTDWVYRMIGGRDMDLALPGCFWLPLALPLAPFLPGLPGRPWEPPCAYASSPL